MSAYEIVVGLEVHCQLRTREKMFCACAYTYGAPPNTQICPVCLGLPGAMPTLNQAAVGLAVRLGVALGCEVQPRSAFDRKHYFYPDLPKGYQITQDDAPILIGGALVFDVDGVTERVRLTRIHLEEDAGKSCHGQAGGTVVDLNRAGVPLAEVVSEPDLRSAKAAVAYLKALRALVRTLGVCEGSLETGSFRCDANVSVRPVGCATLGVRNELKNLNSFKNIQRAIEYEAARQIRVLDGGGQIEQATRTWHEARGESAVMRAKGDARDYRFFPEPDLPHLHVSPEQIDAARGALPELPRARWLRFQAQYGLSAYDAGVLTSEDALADYYEAAVTAHPNVKLVANWVSSELLARVAPAQVGAAPVSPTQLARLVALIDDGSISGRSAKVAFEAMMAGEGGADEVVLAHGLKQNSDVAALEAICRQVIEANPKQLAQLLGGKARVRGFFVGQVMKATRGQGNPKLVNETLARLLPAVETA